MGHFTKMISMAKTPEQINYGVKADAPITAAAKNVPSYPYGLCINLETEQLEALGIDGDCEVGDMIHLSAMAEVTSCSERKTEGGSDCRIELQITHLGLENEDEEGEGRKKSRYGDDERMGDGLDLKPPADDAKVVGDQPMISRRKYKTA